MNDINEMLKNHFKPAPGRIRWKGICPFHKEKTPSCVYNSEEGLFYCLGCGERGDKDKIVNKLLEKENN